MAAVIHSLWAHGDKNALILPANIPIDNRRIQFELTRYLSDNWTPIIEKDVDGSNSLQFVWMGIFDFRKICSLPQSSKNHLSGISTTQTAADLSLEDRRVKLGCAMPGESPSIFGDALRRLSGAATYLYQDGTRYWFYQPNQPSPKNLQRFTNECDDSDRILRLSKRMRFR